MDCQSWWTHPSNSLFPINSYCSWINCWISLVAPSSTNMLSCQHHRNLIRACRTLGSVWVVDIQDSREGINCSQILEASAPFHTHTCGASSWALHLGQWEFSRCFQRAMNLPTPHIPAECLVTKKRLCLGTSCHVISIASQSIRNWCSGRCPCLTQ